MPKGKLEVILVKGQDLKLKNESFRPILEFRIGSQRILQDEQVNPMRAAWKDKTMIFDTQAWSDSIEMRIFVEQEQRVGSSSMGGGGKI